MDSVTHFLYFLGGLVEGTGKKAGWTKVQKLWGASVFVNLLVLHFIFSEPYTLCDTRKLVSA